VDSVVVETICAVLVDVTVVVVVDSVVVEVSVVVSSCVVVGMVVLTVVVALVVVGRGVVLAVTTGFGFWVVAFSVVFLVVVGGAVVGGGGGGGGAVVWTTTTFTNLANLGPKSCNCGAAVVNFITLTCWLARRPLPFLNLRSALALRDAGS